MVSVIDCHAELMPLDGAGKRAFPIVPNDEKLARLVRRVRGETRPVLPQDFEAIRKNMTDIEDLVGSLADGTTTIGRKIEKLPLETLEALLGVGCGGTGSANGSKHVTAMKLVFPEIAEAESHVLTLKAIFASALSDATAAYAMEYHSLRQPEYAELRHVEFFKFIEVVIDVRKQELADAAARQRLQHQATELQETARRMAQAMLSEHLANQAASGALPMEM